MSVWQITHIFCCTINNERRRVLSSIDFEGFPEILRRKKDSKQKRLCQTKLSCTSLTCFKQVNDSYRDKTNRIYYWVITNEDDFLYRGQPPKVRISKLLYGVQVAWQETKHLSFSVLRWTRICQRQSNHQYDHTLLTRTAVVLALVVMAWDHK